MKPTILILLGPPGAGKGSQAILLSKNLKIPHIASGNLLREEIAKGTTLGLEAKKFIDKGEFPPEKLILEVLFDRISRPDCERGYILDGVPRTLFQAEKLENYLEERGELIAISLEISDQDIIDRIAKRRICSKCQTPYHIDFYSESSCEHCNGALIQRSDDNAEVVSRRLEVYREKTAPVIEFYQNRRALQKVDGSQPVEAVQEQIKATLSELAPTP